MSQIKHFLLRDLQKSRSQLKEWMKLRDEVIGDTDKVAMWRKFAKTYAYFLDDIISMWSPRLTACKYLGNDYSFRYLNESGKEVLARDYLGEERMALYGDYNKLVADHEYYIRADRFEDLSEDEWFSLMCEVPQICLNQIKLLEKVIAVTKKCIEATRVPAMDIRPCKFVSLWDAFMAFQKGELSNVRERDVLFFTGLPDTQCQHKFMMALCR